MPEDPEDDDPPEDEESEEEDASEEEEDASEEEEDASEEEEASEDDEDPEEDAEDEASEEEEDTSEEEEASEDDEDPEEDAEDEASEDDDAADEEASDDEDGTSDVDDDVYASRDEWPDAEDEDFEDDAGDWSADDYHEVAETLFGEHEFFGDTAEQRYIDEGFTPLGDEIEVVRGVRERLPGSSTVRFFERDGSIVPRGFLTTTAFALLEAAYPDLDLSFLRITVPRRERPAALVDGGGARALPAELQNVAPADSVDLRKYATPIGDQGSTSRCAAFAWTHALEMLANMQGRPYPRLACSFTMLRFQQLQGDAKDFRWAWKGGDGTSGTWEPGHHLFTNGTCRHDYWPNDSKEPHVPIHQLEADSANHRLDADVYDVTIDDMKKLLTAGLPVQISMATGDAFQDIGRDGVMKVSEAPKGQHGFHAMLCVGYVGNYFIVKNSWGEDWGDNGYCYIPKKVLAESQPEAVAIVPRRGAAPPAPPPGALSPTGMTAGAGRIQAPPPPMAPPPVVPPAPAMSVVACPRCTKQVPHGKFCRECGGPLPIPQAAMPAPRFCSSCGAPREGAGRFCARCGAKHHA